MIPELRARFNQAFTPANYQSLLLHLETVCGLKIEFRVAETPVFVPFSLLDQMAEAGAEMARLLMQSEAYMAAARKAIPPGFLVAGETLHPHFLTADFALVHDQAGELAIQLVEIQAFPSVFGYQALLTAAYQSVFALQGDLGCFLGGLNSQTYWDLLGKTILAGHDPENVVLTEVDPLHQKTRPDFEVTAARFGISVVDIASLEPIGNKLYYRNAAGRRVPITRIYNRAIADELIARNIRLPFDLAREWDVEWAGHPNWYFLLSKFSLPYLSRAPLRHSAVPPAVFLSDFLEGPGRDQLAAAGVDLPSPVTSTTTFTNLLLKPLFSFAGKGIQFDPTRADLERIPPQLRREFLLQQRMQFVPTIDTPAGLTQAEFRILYMWPDGGRLTPALSLVRLGRGKMMGVDHNREQKWVGASAAFFPGHPIAETGLPNAAIEVPATR